MTLSNSEELVSDLNTGQRTRSRVRRERVDSQAFDGRRSVFNMAFVPPEYFGYLRHDPDPGGFRNWLTYLNNNPGDFHTMGRCFVNSIECRAKIRRP